MIVNDCIAKLFQKQKTKKDTFDASLRLLDGTTMCFSYIPEDGSILLVDSFSTYSIGSMTPDGKVHNTGKEYIGWISDNKIWMDRTSKYECLKKQIPSAPTTQLQSFLAEVWGSDHGMITEKDCEAVAYYKSNVGITVVGAIYLLLVEDLRLSSEKGLFLKSSTLSKDVFNNTKY